MENNDNFAFLLLNLAYLGLGAILAACSFVRERQRGDHDDFFSGIRGSAFFHAIVHSHGDFNVPDPLPRLLAFRGRLDLTGGWPLLLKKPRLFPVSQKFFRTMVNVLNRQHDGGMPRELLRIP